MGELQERCGTLGCDGELVSQEVKGDFLARWDKKATRKRDGQRQKKPGLLETIWLTKGGFPGVLVLAVVFVALRSVWIRHREVEGSPLISLALIAAFVLIGLGVGVVRSRAALRDAENL